MRLQVFCGSAEWYSDLGTAGPAEYIWKQWGRICPHLLLMGAAIFVHSGAEGALKMCVRVRAYNTFLVRTRADVRRRAPHVRTSIF